MLNWINKKMKKRKGFTLVELVVVIAILGILAGIAVPKFSASQDKAKLSAHLSNIRVIEGAIAMYKADKGVEPTDLDILVGDYLSSKPTKPGEYAVTNGQLTATPSLEETENAIDEKGTIDWKTLKYTVKSGS